MTTANQQGQVILTLTDVLLSYLYLFKPYVTTDKKTGKVSQSYSGHAIFPPNGANHAAVKAAIHAAAKAGWKDQADAVLAQLAAQDRLCIHSGDVNKPGQEGYAGNLFVSANSRVKPRAVVTRDGVNVEIGEDDPCAPYSGCRGNVMVAIWAQGGEKPSEYGKRINAQLMGVQFLKHGQRFGGGRIASPDEFAVVATDADGAVPMQQPAAAPSNSLI